MKRSLWVWTFWISLAVLIMLILFTIGIWILVNIGGILFIMLSMGSEDIQVGGISLAKFLENFVGSPLFYIYLVDLTALIGSIVGLIVTRERRE